MKEILKYIQLYTGCNDHALKRIEVMLEPRLQPKIIEKIVEVEVPKFINADGQSNLANNTNVYILMGAIIVSLAIISLK